MRAVDVYRHFAKPHPTNQVYGGMRRLATLMGMASSTLLRWGDTIPERHQAEVTRLMAEWNKETAQ